jgi:hypothetical protein
MLMMLREILRISSSLSIGLIEIPPSALRDPIFLNLNAECGHALIAPWDSSASVRFRRDLEISAKL